MRSGGRSGAGRSWRLLRLSVHVLRRPHRLLHERRLVLSLWESLVVLPKRTARPRPAAQPSLLLSPAVLPWRSVRAAEPRAEVLDSAGPSAVRSRRRSSASRPSPLAPIHRAVWTAPR